VVRILLGLRKAVSDLRSKSSAILKKTQSVLRGKHKPEKEIKSLLKGSMHEALGLSKAEFDRLSIDQIDRLVKKKLADRPKLKQDDMAARHMKSITTGKEILSAADQLAIESLRRKVPHSPAARRYVTKVRKMKQFAAIMHKKVGINIPTNKLEEVYDAALASVPRVELKRLRGYADAVEVTIERGGQRHTLVEARQPEVIGMMRSKKKSGWKSDMRMSCKKGMMSLAHLKRKPTVISLGYRGGAHYDYHIHPPYEIAALADFYGEAKKKLIKRGLIRI
jgi:hypothetical protein